MADLAPGVVAPAPAEEGGVGTPGGEGTPCGGGGGEEATGCFGTPIPLYAWPPGGFPIPE